jgi:tetratricopeptide (TPR) repeat protein
VVLLEYSGIVEFSDRGSDRWNRVYETNRVFQVGDRGRTGPRSRATLQLSDLSLLRLAERTEFTVEPPEEQESSVAMSFLRGLAWVFHRDRPASGRFRSRGTTAATRGTEFVLEVGENGAMTLTVLEGEAELRNAAGVLHLGPGEQGTAEPGQAPRPTSVVPAQAPVQWLLYYPGVVDPADFHLDETARAPFEPSWKAYVAGDLPRAMSLYPPDRVPDSRDEEAYLAALLLSSGQVREAEAVLGRLPSGEGSVARALQAVVAATQGSPFAAPTNTRVWTASEWLADSYVRQAAGDLDHALESASAAVRMAPGFGFGWVRVAELEFSHGRAAAAVAALDRGDTLVPGHAQAAALRGFVLAARNEFAEAERAFDRAIQLDGALSNGWLGRGLCRIRRGEAHAGRTDLEVAAALEPRRALLRSYLAKAWSLVGDDARALRELDLARLLDPGDPTAWYYSALIQERTYHVNDAVRQLEEAQRLGGNRGVYRSRLLLDQDRAVRGANLARIYGEAGLEDVGLLEAGAGVVFDYSSFSSHLFLADAYDALRDPNQVNLRYETPWLSEYLVANLLAPAAAGVVSQPVSQQEYSRLFEQPDFGLVSSTRATSGSDWLQTGVQYGVLDHSSYALESYYRSRKGTRINNDLETTAFDARYKHDLTAADSLYLQLGYADTTGGDLNPYYFASDANPSLRTHESQEPVFLVGYHHEWNPGIHTLLLGGRLEDTLRVANPYQQAPYFGSF